MSHPRYYHAFMNQQDKHFGTIGLHIGDRIYGPCDSEAVVTSGGGGTLVKVLKPHIAAPKGFPHQYDPGKINYSLSMATKRILGIRADDTLDKDVFEYWYFQGRKLSEY